MKHISQATSTAIVHSFTHHPDLNPMVPMLLLNGKVFQILLYDCKKDILLISSEVEYVGEEFSVSSGLVIQWPVINHRYSTSLNCLCILLNISI